MKFAKRTVGATAVGALLAAAGCAQNPPPFEPLAMQQGERTAAFAPREAMRPLPTTLQSTYLPTTNESADSSHPTSGPTTGPSITPAESVSLTLQEVIQRAVLNNLDVKVAGYTPAIDETRVVEAEAHFDPQAFFNGTYISTDAPNGGFSGLNSSSGGGLSNIGGKYDEFVVGPGIRQILSSGGQIEASYQAAYVNPSATDDFYENSLILSITQPLLQNAGYEVNHATIHVSRNTQKISLLQFRDTLADTLSKIEQTYWQLVQAQRNVQIQEELLQRTMDTATILAKRLQGGIDVSRVQTSQANATVEARRATLIRAKATVRDLSDQLKRLMNDPQFPVSGPAVILPASTPLQEPVHMDLNDQIKTAMANRLELAQQQLRIDSAATAVRVGKNALLPQLNLIGRASVDGVGDNFGKGFSDQMDFGNISGSVGFEFVFPLGNRAARAQWTRTLLQRQQAITQYQALVSQVGLEVKEAQRNIHTSWDEMVATRQSRFSAADALLAIQQREDANEPLTPTFVQLKLDRQAALATAEASEIQAIVNYNIALVQLEKANGTLLRYNNVLLEEDSLPFAKRLFSNAQ
jgi:outer membrane protein TolC